MGLTTKEWCEWRNLCELQRMFKGFELRKTLETFASFVAFEKELNEREEKLRKMGA